MNTAIKPRNYAVMVGVSYWIMFFAAIFSNFFVIESLINNPVSTVQQDGFFVRAGIIGFLITAFLDVVIAWALYELYKHHALSMLAMLLRMTHAVIMAVAIFSLPAVLTLNSGEEILKHVNNFNNIWLIGLFFFGAHLILLSKIIGNPKLIGFFLFVAGMMYMIDTAAHFALPNYEAYSGIFLMLVAIPGIIGEMSLATWFLIRGGKEEPSVSAIQNPVTTN